MKIALFALFIAMAMFPFFSRAQDSAVPGDAYGFSFTSITGEPLPLSTYRGKAVLVVNTASRCGFTKQYAGLETLYKTYKDRGLVILGVPANNFANQEPGSNEEIKKFCDGVYRITFPLTDKTSVVGKDAHPFYQWAGAQKKGGVLFSVPRWNFHKYLIAPDGTLAASFASATTPESSEMLSAIEKILPVAP
jgi:glutathione peroxidase